MTFFKEHSKKMGGGGLPTLSERSEDYEYDDDDKEGLSGYATETDSESQDQQQQPQLAEKETRLVFGSKILVFLVLAMATIGCAVATYWFTAKSDNAVFETDVSCVSPLCTRLLHWRLHDGLSFIRFDSPL